RAGRPTGDRAGRVIGVLVSGEGTNLQALIDSGVRIEAVASNRAEARALERARAAGIPAAVFEGESARAGWLEGRGGRGVVLAGYMRLLTPAFLDRFDPVVNVHPSLLPSSPGLHAIDQALAAGVETTGVTVHLVDEGIDTGPVLRQESVPVEPVAT